MMPFATTARRAVAAAAVAASAGLLTACGSAAGPSAHPTVTVTVTASASTAAPGAPTVTPTPTPSGPPGCTTSSLTASLGQGSGAAGSVYYPIEFTNNGPTCTLYGYPGVSFVSASGAQVGAAAGEDPTYPRRLVTLAQGATAHADLQITVAQNYPAATCRPVAVKRLRIFPPGQTSALYVSVAATTGCGSTAVTILHVQTVQPGSGNP